MSAEPEDGQPITDPVYWDGVWGGAGSSRVIDPRAPGPRNYVNRHLHGLFSEVFATHMPTGKRLVEVGCGASRWLPYFRSEFGFQVAGIDYSARGCTTSRGMLAQSNVDGEIVQADIFDPPENMRGEFDVVWTNGLVEHFSDTRAAVAACAELLSPGGIMITLVPNMTSLLGCLQRWFNRPLYEKHVPLGCDALAAAHTGAGLELLSCRHFLLAHWGVLHLGALERLIGARPAQALKVALGMPIWALGPQFGLRPNQVTSPYLICVAAKPTERIATQ